MVEKVQRDRWVSLSGREFDNAPAAVDDERQHRMAEVVEKYFFREMDIADIAELVAKHFTELETIWKDYYDPLPQGKDGNKQA